MSSARIGLSLALCLSTALLCGCPKAPSRELGKEADVDNTAPPSAHDHDHGPHGGHIVELGEHHGEVVMSPERVVTLYILGADAKTAVPLADAAAKLHIHAGTSETEIDMVAAPLVGEADGKTSAFTASGLPDSIKDIEDLKGEVILIVGEKTTKGKITHDHHH